MPFENQTTLSEWLGIETVYNNWQHVDIRFDLALHYLALRTGEEYLYAFDNIEDTKGNPGLLGSLKITNMRIIWQVAGSRRLNLSIGWDNVSHVHKGKPNNTTGKQVLLLASGKTKFEFVFTSSDHDLLFYQINTVYKSFTKSSLYRHTLTKQPLISRNELILLKHECLIYHISGVFHVSDDEGIIGDMYLTNIRVVWHSALDPLLNCSVPYLEMVQIQVKDSKYGQALVIESKGRNAVYMYGFRIDPRDKLLLITKQVRNLWKLYQERPIFGVDLIHDDDDDAREEELDTSKQHIFIQETEEIEIIHESKSNLNIRHSLMQKNLNELIFDDYLGLAIQPITVSDQSISTLWKGF